MKILSYFLYFYSEFAGMLIFRQVADILNM